MTSHPLETLTADDFLPCQGTLVRMSARSSEGGSREEFEAEVVEITQYTGTSGTFRNPFSVVFHGPLEPVRPQGTYWVEHEHLGGLELFVVPLGPNEPAVRGDAPTVMRYEAVFG
jgi:Domain of unknown function (DUF6916)